TWTCGLDVTGQCQGTGAEMEHGEWLTGLCGQIHHMTDPAKIFVEDLRGVGHVHVGLFSATDAEDVTAFNERIGINSGVLPCGPQETRGVMTAGVVAAGVVAAQSRSLSAASRSAASSRTLVFLQKAKRNKLRVRCAPSGWQKTGTGIAATPTRAGNRRARSTESLMPKGSVATLTK